MTKKTIFETVAKIFGLYCIVQFVRSTPGAIGAILMNNSEFVTNKALYIVLMSLYPLVFLLLSIVFLKKTHLIVKIFNSESDSKDTETIILSKNKSAYNDLSFWIIIIGIFYFISAMSVVLSNMGTFAIKIQEAQLLIHDPLLPQIVILILSLICIFRSEQIAKFIETKKKKET